MSHKIMIQTEERKRDFLNSLLLKAEEAKLSEDENELRLEMNKLKAAHNEFRKISLELSAWYDKNGSKTTSCEVDDDRRSIFGEFKLVYGKLNNRVKELGFSPGSSVGNPSECSRSFIDQGIDSVNQWLQKENPSVPVNQWSQNENPSASVNQRLHIENPSVSVNQWLPQENPYVPVATLGQESSNVNLDLSNLNIDRPLNDATRILVPTSQKTPDQNAILDPSPRASGHSGDTNLPASNIGCIPRRKIQLNSNNLGARINKTLLKIDSETPRIRAGFLCYHLVTTIKE